MSLAEKISQHNLKKPENPPLESAAEFSAVLVASPSLFELPEVRLTMRKVLDSFESGTRPKTGLNGKAKDLRKDCSKQIMSEGTITSKNSLGKLTQLFESSSHFFGFFLVPKDKK